MPKRKRPPRPARAFGYGAAIVLNIILWYVVHNLDSLHLPVVIVEEFHRVLPAFEVSIGATIIANGCFLAFDPPIFRSAGQVVLNLLSLNVTWAMYRYFPFDFGTAGVNSFMRYGLLLVMFALGVATVVEVVRLPFGRRDW